MGNSKIDNPNNKRCIVVIPAYKTSFNHDEEMCVKKYAEVLCDEELYFIVPESLDLSYYSKTFPEVKTKTYEDKYFKGILGYNKLMLSRDFYNSLSNYEYMLIAQPDAVIWREENMLSHFMDLGFDYYGAPWIPARRIWEWAKVPGKNGKGKMVCLKKEGNGIEMGNGGFSLRRVSQCEKLIKQYGWRKCYWYIKRNEDIFFGVFGRFSKCDFKLCDTVTGLRFAGEYGLKDLVEKGETPFGVHGWSKEFASFEEMQNYLLEKNVWKHPL